MILYEINAIRRSGHHAFINWLICNINNIKYNTNLCNYKFNHIVGPNNILWVNEGEHDHVQVIQYINDYIKTHKDPIIIISYESPTHLTVKNPNYSILESDKTTSWKIDKHYHIPFVRDFYNNIASLFSLIPSLTIEGLDNDVLGRYLNLYFGILSKYTHRSLGVNYDSWVTYNNYSNDISWWLLNKPQKFTSSDIKGTDSSFNTKSSDYLTRYKLCKYPEWFKEKIRNNKKWQDLLWQFKYNKNDIDF